jgi:hypothetical protein
MVLTRIMLDVLGVSFIRLRVIPTAILDMFMFPTMVVDANARSGVGISDTQMIV